VATGSIKAQLALIAAGIMSSFGSIEAATAVTASIGISRDVVAVLLVISVRKVTARHNVRRMKKISHFAMAAKVSPIAVDSPVLLNAAAMDNPAPKSISIPHSIFAAESQSRSFSPLPFGIRNMQITLANATM
tara:strand:- start:3311 stop:3709 length:399 start_codon:yes stop_codon:yes gene_type:complete